MKFYNLNTFLQYRIDDLDIGKTYHQMFSELSKYYGFVVLGIYRRVEDTDLILPIRSNNLQKKKERAVRKNSAIEMFKRGL